MDIAVTGLVEKFVNVNPPRVMFRGPVGASLKTRVAFMPKEKYPFKITGVRARQGNFFKFELSEQIIADKLQYVLTLENTRETKGRYADIIYLDTDSRLKPRIQIPVVGYLYEQKKSHKK